MTPALITETIIWRAKAILAALFLLAVVNFTLLVAQVFILQRVQLSQDELAVTQSQTVEAASKAASAAEETQVSARRAEDALLFLCRRVASVDCPAETTTTSTVAGG